MNLDKITRTPRIKALGLCSGGLDSMLSALVLKKQGIEVTWISFETPFFSSESARNASARTGIELIIQDITKEYLKMLHAPKAGYGKNLNPCMDCHALMFARAGELMKEMKFDFLFSGEVVGQRPKSQTKNALRYVEKNSGMQGTILRPLSAKCLPETPMENKGLVDRSRLLDISGRSRKVQMNLAQEFGIKDYPAPAGGCLLTDPGFSRRLRDLFFVQETDEVRQIHLLKHGRHFRLNSPESPEKCKLIVGRNKSDNRHILSLIDPEKDIRLRHASLPGPDAVLTGDFGPGEIQTAAAVVASYTKAKPGTPSEVRIIQKGEESLIQVTTPVSSEFKDLII